MTETSTKNIQTNNNDCSPLNSIYCTLKMNLTGNLNEMDLKNLYRCTLCNQCKIAGFNRGTREKAVCNNFITPHVTQISENISKFGNSYGIDSLDDEESKGNMETILFRGCTPKYKAQEILKAAINLLTGNGVKYGIIKDETCCGNILFNLGNENSGLEVVRENIEKFKVAGVKKIITICPGCYNAFNKYYKGQEGFDPEIILAIDLLDGLTFTDEDLFLIQDPCHAREKAVSVRRILSSSRNKSVSPCCGAGAGVMAYDKQLASTKAKKTVNKNHEKIITYCPFCYLNMSSVKPDKVTDIYVLLDDQNKAKPSK